MTSSFRHEYAPRRDREEINFLEALAGLILAPHETTHLLFQGRDPPYGWTLFVCFICSLYVPVVAQHYKYGYSIWDSGAVVACTLVLFFGLLIFLFLEGIFLQVLRIDFNMQMLFSCVAYSLTPMILGLWLIYGFNFLSEGKLTVFTFLLTGFGSLDDKFLEVLPYAVGICGLWILIVFTYSVRNMAQVSVAVGFLTACLSVLPLAAALTLGLLVADYVRPGAFELCTSMLNLPVFSGSY